jgi:hypothetical protein
MFFVLGNSYSAIENGLFPKKVIQKYSKTSVTFNSGTLDA